MNVGLFHHNSKEDLVKEFNLNYKNYLENLILFQSINEIINEKKSKTTATPSSNNSINVSSLSSSNEKLLNRFWKSNLLTNVNLNDYLAKVNNENDVQSSATSFLSNSFSSTTPQTEYLVSQFQMEDLSNELKNEIINEIERYYDVYLNKLENMTKSDIEENYTSYDRSVCLTRNIKEIVYSIEQNSKLILKFNDDISLKVKSYLNLTHEILNLLMKLVNEFKLGFYLRKDLACLDTLLFKCDILLTKIEAILGEILEDTYTSDKLKCFRMIQENTEMMSMKYRKKYESMTNALNTFKSLGAEFESIHKSYIELKDKLRDRIWTLNKLNNEMFY